MSLDATPSGPDSNSYCDVASADLYHDNRLHNDEWDNAGNQDKESALIQATSMLDDLDWSGSVDLDSDQALRFPRINLTDKDGRTLDGIPKFLVSATCELALSLLRSEDVSPEAATKRIKVATIEMEYFEASVSVGTLPENVHNIVVPYLTSGNNSVQVVRV